MYKNLIGDFFKNISFLIKIFAITFLVFLISFLKTNLVLAKGEFYVDAQVQYDFNEKGVAHVVQNINLENAYATLYAKKYTLTLENLSPQNIYAKSGGKPLKFLQSKENSLTKIEVFLDNPAIGKGKKNNFSISFDTNNLSTKTGKVWEISIPKLNNKDVFRKYKVELIVPDSFGNAAYISPKPYTKNEIDSKKHYYFDKESLLKTGVTVGFGNFQVFSFTINYHLENPLNIAAETNITLPPDTAFQKMYYEKIDPKPENVSLDSDGNWIAHYNLSPRERLNVQALGSVQIFSSERKFPRPSLENLTKNLSSNKYWQSNDPEIIKIAKDLKTPQRIYNYVVNHLKYDYDRVKPNVRRLGAKEALSNPESAICMEFTDLFIALSRAAGIPAREVNGYAYTENPEIQPLSLVADVLHSWPEYWDNRRLVWVPVDPTWGDTTGGIDYFSKLDLRHFVFVIHGERAEKPYAPGSYKLGKNPQKDVFVNFSKLPKVRKADLRVNAHFTRQVNLFGSKLLVEIYNPGPTALYDLKPEIRFDKKKVFGKKYDVLLPYSKVDFEVKVPFKLFGINTASDIYIIVADKTKTLTGNKIVDIIASVIMLLLFLFILAFVVLSKYHKIKISQLIKRPENFKKVDKTTDL